VHLPVALLDAALVSKPFTRDELIRAVREMLP
jgi:hypothetical protein